MNSINPASVLHDLYNTVRQLNSSHNPIRAMISDNLNFCSFSYGTSFEYQPSTPLQKESVRLYTDDHIRVLSLYDIKDYTVIPKGEKHQIQIETENKIKIFLDL